MINIKKTAYSRGEILTKSTKTTQYIFKTTLNNQHLDLFINIIRCEMSFRFSSHSYTNTRLQR